MLVSEFRNNFAVNHSGLAKVGEHFSHIVGGFGENKFTLFRRRSLGWSVLDLRHSFARESLDSGLEIHSDYVGQAVNGVPAAVLICLRKAVPLVGFGVYVQTAVAFDVEFTHYPLRGKRSVLLDLVAVLNEVFGEGYGIEKPPLDCRFLDFPIEIYLGVWYN